VRPNRRPPEWTRRRERGAVPLIKVFVWIALRVGRPTARLFLYPICLYFLALSPKSRRASRQYLARVLERRPRIGEIFRHYHALAATILDRVFFLNDQIGMFELEVHGEEILLDILRRRSGCILLGAHFGSFEAARALGRRQPDIRISLVMYEENARKIGAVLNAINPALALEVIALGNSSSLLEVRQRLDDGHFVGILADRAIVDEDQLRVPFLGAPAAFPLGPAKVAALMGTPVVLMFPIYRGGRRYDLFFETLAERGEAREESAEQMIRRYALRLEHYCRLAPFNWFNFYDFWA
jgi:predicted LPLAT superfamily acyltransferase